MRLLALVVALACMAAGGYVAAAHAFAAHRPATPLETSLSAQGLDVQRAVASPLPVLLRPGAAPDVVILAGAGHVPAAERSALASFARDGGEVWIVGPSAQPAAWHGGDAWTLQVLPGQIVASNSTTPVLTTASGVKVAADGTLAIGSMGSAFHPYLSAPLTSFRDSNGDGKLSEGEPAGPFLVAATAQEGQGRLVFLAADDPSGALTPDLVKDLLAGRHARVLVVDHDALASWQVPAATVLEEAATLGQPWLGVALLVLGLVAALGIVLARVTASVRQADKATHLVRRLAHKAEPHRHAHPDNPPGDHSP